MEGILGIEMYALVVTHEDCKKCDMVKNLLQKLNIDFKEVNHIAPMHEYYPMIYFNGKRYDYDEFIIEIRKLEMS